MLGMRVDVREGIGPYLSDPVPDDGGMVRLSLSFAIASLLRPTRSIRRLHRALPGKFVWSFAAARDQASCFWSAIADISRREFNDRLKAAKVTTGRWHTGTNLVDRLLGKELCILAWAAETANDDQLPVIASKWAALRPEERWWLFSMTAAEAGLPEDTQRGWRRALFLALSDGEKPPADRKRRRPAEDDVTSLPLFQQTA
jgi:hypothetical protein